jgi:hypothetical protein
MIDGNGIMNSYHISGRAFNNRADIVRTMQDIESFFFGNKWKPQMLPDDSMEAILKKAVISDG